MNTDGNYPTLSQSDLKKAPWNSKDEEEKEIDLGVTVSTTLSKYMVITVPADYTQEDLENVVRERLNSKYTFKGWDEDEFIVTEDDVIPDWL